MMKTFKVILIILGLTISIMSYSQAFLGIKVGGNLSKMKIDIYDENYGDVPDTHSKLGFQVGLTSDITIVKERLSLQSGLKFTTKGYCIDFSNVIRKQVEYLGYKLDEYKGCIRMNYYYLELPVNFVLKFNSLQIFAGPYFAVGLGGRFKHDFSYVINGEQFDSNDIYDEDYYKLEPVFGIVDDEKYKSFLDNKEVIDLYRAYDYGINFGVGYKVNKFLINTGYSIGLANVTPDYNAKEFDIDIDYTNNVIQKNMVFDIAISYFFMKRQ